ncbi:MAG: molybdopterin-guanine dinucleotide biosynthesis protein B [Spirochaetes bacterium]|nr:molybdopterin-guanine dinucleotide biosynthesis protein B [Spirochaetota bacterium]
MATKKTIPTIAFVGRSNVGKTSLIEKLINHFSSQGIRVAVIKHTHQKFELDHPGKDTYRFRKAGAHLVSLTSTNSIAIIGENSENLPPVKAAPALFESCDLIIVEGNKEGNYKKIEVIGTNDEAPLYQLGIGNIIALVCDKKVDINLPVFSRNDIEGIAQFIENMLLSRSE